MKYFLQFILLFCVSVLSAQTTLISPTVNNGGFENSTAAPWVISNGTQTNKWQVSTGANPGFTGTKSAYISSSSAAPFSHNYNEATSSAVFIYQDVVFPAGETIINLSFKVKVQGETSWDFLSVFLVEQNATPIPGSVLTTATYPVNWTYNMLGNGWITQNISITSTQAGNATNASPKRLIFQWKNDNGGGMQPPAAIDDITLTTSSCATVTATAATNITQTSAQANWTTLAGATDYYLEYRPAGASAWNMIQTGNVTSYALTGLLPNNNYEYRVTPIGGSCSASSNIISFKTGYCDAGSSSQLSWLQSFVSGGAVSSISYTSPTLTSSPLGYKDESANYSVNHYAGSSFDLQMYAGGSPPGFSVWIDWNNNFVFESTERAYNSNGFLGNASPQITVPAGTANGQYRMRVMLDTNNPDPSIACGNIAAGEIVDFSLNVVPAPTCYPPTNLAIGNITANTAELTFTAPVQGSPVSYEYYLSTGSAPPIAATVPTGNSTGVSVALAQLQSATNYYVWVRSICGGTDKSSWSSALAFTTTCGVFTLPYSQNFENVVSGFPVCTSVQNAGNGNIWIVDVPDTNGFSTNTLSYYYDTASPGNAWFFTPAIALEAGREYSVSFKYGNDGDSSYPEKLKVAYGTAANAASMVNLLQDYPNIVTSGPVSEKLTFTASATGTFYFGFNAYSDADKNVLMVDDILIEVEGVIWDGSQWSNITGPTSTLNAYIDGNYTGGSITSADLTISAGVSVLMNGALNAANISNNGNLVIGQDGTMMYTGSFANSGSGTFAVEKDVTAAAVNQYSFWSSPVASQSMFGIFDTGTPQFVTDYTPSGAWVAVASPATSVRGKGYSVKTPAGATLASFEGTPNHGNITTTISAPNASPAANYVLLGNPYPSLLSLQTFTTVNSAKLNGNYWLWDKAAENYATYNAGSDTYVAAPGSTVALVGGSVQPAQGFLAEAIAGSTSVAFNNTMRSTGSTGYFNKTAAGGTEGKLWLRLNASSTDFSSVAVTYGYGENGMDRTDAKSLSETPNDLFTMVGTERVIIQGRGSFSGDDAVALGVKLSADAQYTITLEQAEGIFANGQEVILHDREQKIFHNLSQGAYTFQGSKGENEGRFEILYRKAAQLTAVSEVTIAKNGEVFTVTSPEPIRMVEVYDTAGRLVKKVQGGGTTLDLPISARGAYVVNIVTVKETVSKKVIK